MVTSEVGEAIAKLALQDDRPIAYVIRKLIEESPRIKAALKKRVKK